MNLPPCGNQNAPHASKTPQHKSLPEPSAEAKQHSQKLTAQIARLIQRHGPLSFSRFMEKALYTPELGYYASGLPKMGKNGDFITAPEISAKFSQCLAQQTAQVLNDLNQKNIIEFGAGQGTMAQDILLTLDQQDCLPDHYYIIELSSDLQARQEETIKRLLPAHLASRVSWLKQLPQSPIEAVVLANEVLDAMPVERVKIEPEQATQAFVAYDAAQERFNWHYQPITSKPLQGFANQLIQHLGKVSNLGYEAEINLNIKPWLNALSQVIERGLVLLIDYGYNRDELYQPAQVMGTLRCHYQQRAHQDPFFYPGLQDITAHVDFTGVAEDAFDVGFKVAGFTTQAHFLMATGLLENSHNPDTDVTQQLQDAQQIKTLTLPNEMGETFKAMALTKQYEKPLIGFAIRDLRHQL